MTSVTSAALADLARLASTLQPAVGLGFFSGHKEVDQKVQIGLVSLIQFVMGASVNASPVRIAGK